MSKLDTDCGECLRIHKREVLEEVIGELTEDLNKIMIKLEKKLAQSEKGEK